MKIRITIDVDRQQLRYLLANAAASGTLRGGANVSKAAIMRRLRDALAYGVIGEDSYMDDECLIDQVGEDAFEAAEQMIKKVWQ